jgi:hypothetical protein
LKRFFIYSFLFGSGLFVGLFFLWQTKDNYQQEQLDIIVNGIKNVQKLVVTEASFSEIYNYEDADKYLFETVAFEKKVILLVNAKVQVSYDLTKMNIQVDSINKKIIIKKLPKEEVTTIPEFKYYDLQQSMWNTFTKEELNKIQQSSIDKLLDTVEISTVKNQAKKQLLEVLSNLFNITNLVGWEIEDQSQNLLIDKNKLINFKN